MVAGGRQVPKKTSGQTRLAFTVITWISHVFMLLHIALILTGTMTEASGEELGATLEKKVEDVFSRFDSLPLSIRKKGIEVRTEWDGACMLALSEAKHSPHHPGKFKPFLKDFNQLFPKVNPMAKNVISLKKEGSVREGVKSELAFPFPLRNRLMIHWKYTRFDRSPHEHLLVISEEDNKDLLKEFHTEHDKKNFVLGRTFLCAYWIKPVFDNNKSVVGSTIRYAFSGDTGGSIPKFVQDMAGPKTAFDSVHGLIQYVETLPN
jgi:hypothetical protein